jgi:SRSO17 transposase
MGETAFMSYEAGAPEMGRLERYLARVTGSLRDHRSRSSFAVYAFGLLTEGERKSMEPMAARMCECPEDSKVMQQTHDRLLHVVSKSEWDDRPVRGEAVGFALDAIRARGEQIEVSIIDDTGFLKQGKHSPGVHRQYTGSAGKTTNCQVAVSMTIASRSTHVPVDMELYLPQAWTDDRARCRAAKIPDDVGYRPKWLMALLMLERAKKSGDRARHHACRQRLRRRLRVPRGTDVARAAVRRWHPLDDDGHTPRTQRPRAHDDAGREDRRRPAHQGVPARDLAPRERAGA